MYYNPYQPSRPVQPMGQSYGYGNSYSTYPGNFYPEANAYYQPRPEAPAAAPAPAPTASATATGSPIAWTDQPLARIYIRPQQYTAAASAEETLRMGTAFPELFRPFTPGGSK